MSKKKKKKDQRDPSREYSPFKFGTHQESINDSFISWRELAKRRGKAGQFRSEIK